MSVATQPEIVRDQLFQAAFGISLHAFQTRPQKLSWQVEVGQERDEIPIVEIGLRFPRIGHHLIWATLQRAEIKHLSSVDRDEQSIIVSRDAEAEIFENDYARFFIDALGNYWHNADNIYTRVKATVVPIKTLPNIKETPLSDPTAVSRPARPATGSGVGILMGPAL